MASTPDAALLNVQPRQRRVVYEALAALLPEGIKVKDLLSEVEIPEPQVRDALRKLDAAGLAVRTKGAWFAIPLEGSEAASNSPAPPEP